MNTITGFDIGDVEGSVITNFLHPADNRRSIHCLKTCEYDVLFITYIHFFILLIIAFYICLFSYSTYYRPSSQSHNSIHDSYRRMGMGPNTRSGKI